MIVAAHQTMMGPQGAPRGSVLFQRTDISKGGLYVESLFSTIPSVWSASAWAKTAENPTYGGIFKLGYTNPVQGGGGAGVGLGIGNTSFSSASPGTNAVVLTESSAWTNFGSAGTITQWKHYAITKNGKTIKVYINGSILASKSLSNYTNGACFFSIGCGHGLSDVPSFFSSAVRLFYGNITRFAMWSTELTAAQVATDYADGGGNPSVTSGLVHYWPLASNANLLTDLVGGATLSGSVNATFSTDTPFA